MQFSQKKTAVTCYTTLNYYQRYKRNANTSIFRLFKNANGGELSKNSKGWSLQDRRNVLAWTESINIIQVHFQGGSAPRWIGCQFHGDLNLIFTPLFSSGKDPNTTMPSTIRRDTYEYLVQRVREETWLSASYRITSTLTLNSIGFEHSVRLHFRHKITQAEE
jgi:transcriptional antiterminator Rof (Rho-off)